MIEVRELARTERPYLHVYFPTPPRNRPYVIVNMVGSLDGKAVITDTEQGLGSAADKDRMQELRAQADAVMNGASTLRKSGASSRVRAKSLVEWRLEHGKPEQPLGVLVTREARFEMRGPYFDGSLPAVIYASLISPERKREIEARGPTVVEIPDRRDNIKAALRDLRSRGVRLLLCEGGPSTNAALLAAGALDELFLTLSPTLVGGHETLSILGGESPTALDDAHRLTPISALANPETGELYLRYRVLRKP